MSFTRSGDDNPDVVDGLIILLFLVVANITFELNGDVA
jgi:hypothetical protein